MNRSGDQLFSRSRRSRQQYVGVMPCHLPREIKYFQHRRAFPDDAVKFQVLQQLLLEGPHAPPLVIQRRDFVQ
jgi:hypothetical protein